MNQSEKRFYTEREDLIAAVTALVDVLVRCDGENKPNDLPKQGQDVLAKVQP